MKLVIVESPSKCKKIEDLLGPGHRCRASVGHICEIANGLAGIDPVTLLPSYAIVKGKTKVVRALQKECREAESVTLATDPDREGEAIAYHLCLFLKLSPLTTKRVRFHELTRDAVRGAFAHPSLLDMNLVRAQQARQVLDLYVGFKVSPLLWKNVGPRLSAGRCQTPALRMLSDRERSLTDPSNLTSHLVMTADFDEEGFCGCVLQRPPKSWDDFVALVDSMRHDPRFVLWEFEDHPKIQNPPPPFITSTVQQDCHGTFHYSPQFCMSVLQSLYEKGKITYMRTDSPTLSEIAVAACRSIIEEKFGVSNFEKRVYASKSVTAQEAHEAIRPTDVAVEELCTNFTDPEKKVYRRIWQRTVASQMVAHRFTERVAKIRCSSTIDFEHTSRETRALGWKLVYGAMPEVAPPIPGPLPCPLGWQKGVITQEFEKSRGRHSESTLVRELEKRGIGRPSTFASLCAKVVERGYAEKKSVDGITVPRVRATIDKDFVLEKGQEEVTLGRDVAKYVVTPTGHQVLGYLSTKVPLILDYALTSAMERDLEIVAQDATQYHKILGSYLSRVDACL